MQLHVFYLSHDILYSYEVGHQNKPPLSNFKSRCGPPVKKFPQPWSRLFLPLSLFSMLFLAVLTTSGKHWRFYIPLHILWAMWQIHFFIVRPLFCGVEDGRKFGENTRCLTFVPGGGGLVGQQRRWTPWSQTTVREGRQQRHLATDVIENTAKHADQNVFKRPDILDSGGSCITTSGE